MAAGLSVRDRRGLLAGLGVFLRVSERRLGASLSGLGFVAATGEELPRLLAGEALRLALTGEVTGEAVRLPRPTMGDV